MTTSTSPTTSSPLGQLRLALADHPSPGKLGGAWWPRSRDLAAELGDLVDRFPEVRGRVVRGLFSRPDWDEAPRKIVTRHGFLKVGSFPDDDTHVVILSMSAAPARLTLLVVPPEASDDRAKALMAASSSTDATDAAALVAGHGVV